MDLGRSNPQMTSQAKNLRAILKKHGVKASVRTQRKIHTYQGKRFFEWGNAVSHLSQFNGVDLTPELVASLRGDGAEVFYSEEHPLIRGLNYATVER